MKTKVYFVDRGIIDNSTVLSIPGTNFSAGGTRFSVTGTGETQFDAFLDAKTQLELFSLDFELDVTENDMSFENVCDRCPELLGTDTLTCDYCSRIWTISLHWD